MRKDFRTGFSLIELLTAMAVMTVILLVSFAVVQSISETWNRSSKKIEAFQGARLGFELLTRNLAQATLNTYLGYNDEADPRYYLRKSDLRFVCKPAGVNGFPGTPGTGSAIFFQAPLDHTTNMSSYWGLSGLLNTCGYFIAFADVPRPSHVSSGSTYRYRLMQLLLPTEQNAVYQDPTGDSWFANFASKAQPIADNIIALIVRPQDPASVPADIDSLYSYDTFDPADATAGPANSQKATSQQLPPILVITLIAIDEASARRLENGSTPPGVITQALAGKFVDTAKYDSDIAEVEGALSGAGIQYRIFSNTIAMLESKWTK